VVVGEEVSQVPDYFPTALSHQDRNQSVSETSSILPILAKSASFL
jgi:hypothetical protein